jgi:cytochrome P450
LAAVTVPDAFAPDRVDFYLGDPHGRFRRLRREDPLHWYAPGPYWCATRHADVVGISRRPRTFSSAHGTQLFEVARRLAGRTLPLEIAPSIIRMDPPQHNRHRKLVIGAFTPRAVAALEPRVRELAREIAAALPEGQPFDFVERVAIPLPMLVIAELLGVPSSDHEDFRRWSDAMIEAGGAGPTPATMATAAELFAYVTAKAAECRRAPRGDLLTKLALAELDGAGLSDAELAIFCMTLLVAGNETTRNLISGGMHALLEHPAQWKKLCADPELVPNAVEEMLRYVSPVQNFVRRVQRDVEVGGKTLRAGEYVALFYGSANRDEAVFGDDADAFEVGRPNARRHVAFGFGEHLCLGAPLARLEARVMFEELLARGPGFRLAGPVARLPSTLMNGMVAMPMALEGRGRRPRGPRSGDRA